MWKDIQYCWHRFNHSEAIELSKFAEKAGVDALLVTHTITNQHKCLYTPNTTTMLCPYQFTISSRSVRQGGIRWLNYMNLKTKSKDAMVI